MSQDTVPGYEDCVLCEHTGVKDDEECPDCSGAGVTLPVVNRKRKEAMNQDTEQCRHCNGVFQSRLIGSAGLCPVCEQRDKEYHKNQASLNDDEPEAISADEHWADPKGDWRVFIRQGSDVAQYVLVPKRRVGDTEESMTVEEVTGSFEYARGFATCWERHINAKADEHGTGYTIDGEEQSDEPSLHNWVKQECTRCGQLDNAAASEICPAWKEGGRPGKMTRVKPVDATNQLDAMEVELDEINAKLDTILLNSWGIKARLDRPRPTDTPF